jgi:hypothetical protein
MRALVVFLLIISCLQGTAHAQEKSPDTVSAGIYITSIHNIDFKQKEYTATFWLWLKYTNPDLDFVNNLEVPNAKSVEKSFFTIDTTGHQIYMQMKMQCVMKDSWRIENFPFDEQKLRISLENSQFDASSLIFVTDTLGEHFDPRFTLRGWNIDSCIITSGKRVYETAFGNPTAEKQETEYSVFRVRLSITHQAAGLFWKMFLGMYLAFLISFICFYIHSDSMDSRFGLSVGALFAVVGNKYINDSALPDSTVFTLVDLLHGLTLLYILLIVAANAYSLKLIKRGQVEKSVRVDNWVAMILLVSYVLINVWLIYQAKKG